MRYCRHDCRYNCIAAWSPTACVCDSHIATHTQRNLIVEFQSFHFVVLLGSCSSGCCSEQCYYTHARMWLSLDAHLWYLPRSGINESYTLHISGLVGTLTDANLPSARSIQLMFIKIEKSSGVTLFLTSSTWRSLKSPGVRVCWTIHSGDGPGKRQEHFL